MPSVRIVEVGVDRLPDVEHLTRALHEHHQTVDPGIPGIPPRDVDAWWAIRRDRYESWLIEPDTFVLVAEEEGAQRPVVEPARRGIGMGTELLHEVYRQVRRRGVGEMVIGVLATNEPAMRFYEREGFRPWVILTLGKVPDPDAQP